MIGFTFANTHSSELGVYLQSDNRTVSPSLRKNEFIIPGRHGSLDFKSSTYNTRVITISLHLIKHSMQDLREQARGVARWLSRSGLLIFDDEPDKAYQAKVYEGIDIEQITSTGVAFVVFECQPFAESLEYRQVNVPGIVSKPYSISLDVKGTSETCPIITIKNTGNANINNIILRRKAAI